MAFFSTKARPLSKSSSRHQAQISESTVSQSTYSCSHNGDKVTVAKDRHLRGKPWSRTLSRVPLPVVRHWRHCSLSVHKWLADALMSSKHFRPLHNCGACNQFYRDTKPTGCHDNKLIDLIAAVAFQPRKENVGTFSDTLINCNISTMPRRPRWCQRH